MMRVGWEEAAPIFIYSNAFCSSNAFCIQCTFLEVTHCLHGKPQKITQFLLPSSFYYPCTGPCPPPSHLGRHLHTLLSLQHGSSPSPSPSPSPLPHPPPPRATPPPRMHNACNAVGPAVGGPLPPAPGAQPLIPMPGPWRPPSPPPGASSPSLPTPGQQTITFMSCCGSSSGGSLCRLSTSVTAFRPASRALGVRSG